MHASIQRPVTLAGGPRMLPKLVESATPQRAARATARTCTLAWASSAQPDRAPCTPGCAKLEVRPGSIRFKAHTGHLSKQTQHAAHREQSFQCKPGCRTACPAALANRSLHTRSASLTTPRCSTTRAAAAPPLTRAASEPGPGTAPSPPGSAAAASPSRCPRAWPQTAGPAACWAARRWRARACPAGSGWGLWGRVPACARGRPPGHFRMSWQSARKPVPVLRRP